MHHLVKVRQFDCITLDMSDMLNVCLQMGVSKNRGTPKSSTLIRFSIINHPFWGTTIFGNIRMVIPMISKFIFKRCSIRRH